jgi:DNA-binding NtrC family response regulator
LIRLISMNITNVLVVDDDIAMCRIVSRMLSNEQFKIETTQSVADAVRAVEEKAFDLYVMDYKLPDGSGLDVAERVRSKWGAAPIILMSGYDPSAVALRAEKLSISEFLEKPFSRETISDAVKKAIETTRAISAPQNIKDSTPKVSGSDRKEPSFGRIRSAIARLGQPRHG